MAGRYQAALGRAHLGRGEFGPAREALRRAIHRMPGDAALRLDYGRLLETLGELEAARHQFARARALVPSPAQREQTEP